MFFSFVTGNLFFAFVINSQFHQLLLMSVPARYIAALKLSRADIILVRKTVVISTS